MGTHSGKLSGAGGGLAAAAARPERGVMGRTSWLLPWGVAFLANSALIVWMLRLLARDRDRRKR